MPGLFESGFKQSIRSAQRRGITSPDQMPTDRSDVWGAYWDVAKVETVSGGVRRRHEQLMFEQMEQLSEYDPEFDPMRFDSGPRPDLYRVAEVERYELALDFFKRNSERIKSLSTQHGQGFQTYEDIHARIEKEQAELRAARDQIASRASPTDRAVGAFLGEGQAVMTDPLIIATLPLGGVARGATHAARIASAMASEAAIIAGIEATMIQPQVYLQKRSINSPYSLVDAGIAVLAAGVGGGALRGVFQSGASAIQAYRAVRGARTRNETVLQLREAAAELVAEDTPQARAEAEVLNDLADVIESTPRNSAIDRTTGQEFHDKNRVLIEAAPDEETQHLANLDQAMDDLAQNRITEVSMDADSPDYISMYNRGELEAVDPRTVEADAKRFQFKAGGDTEGVTDRLKGVEEWDPMRAGISVIYEQADGARFIVDGHQRLALAKRLGDDNIRLNAIVLREVDGVTVGAARRRAALKNIAEGTGTSLDAAKVLREIGVEGLADTSLPPQSALVRTAHALAELDQEAFVYVANVLKPEQYAMASIVGQLIKAGPEQLAAIRALVEADPGTLLQARFIVEQIRAAGFETTETMDLFGGQTISETLFKERAKVLDNAINRLKKDKATFRTLVEREAEISGAGNVLEREANLERLDKDEQTIQTLVRLANTKGPISEALNEAARRLKNGERVDAVTRDFLATAGRPTDERHRIGSEVRDDGRPIKETVPAEDLEPQIGRVVELDKLTELDRLKAEELFRAKQQRKVKTLRGLIGKDEKLAKKHQKELERLGDELSEELGVEHMPPPARTDADGKVIKDVDGDTLHHKVPEQIERKVKDKYGGDYWKITDITRTSFIVDTPAASEAVIRALGKRLESLDEGWHLHADQGYMDRKVLVRYSDGLVGEVQIISREMWSAKFKKGGHAAYYKWRLTHHQDDNGKLVVKDQEAFDTLTKEMSDLYEGANQGSNTEFQSLLESLRASSKTSSTSTVRQRLPGEELDQAVSPPSEGSRTTTTGIPSQESRSTTLSAGGERVVGIDETSDTIISPRRQEWQNWYNKEYEKAAKKVPDYEWQKGEGGNLSTKQTVIDPETGQAAPAVRVSVENGKYIPEFYIKDDNGVLRKTTGIRFDSFEEFEQALKKTATQSLMPESPARFGKGSNDWKAGRSELAEYINDTRALHPDDPEMAKVAEAEARQVADILEQNPDLEIPVEIRVDADGNEVLSTRRATDVYDDLVEEDTRTTDMFTCMTGGGRG